MSVKYDLPTLADSGKSELLLDANYGFYETQKKGDAFVYVEKYAVNKDSYVELPKGTISNNRNNVYMVKQTNYSDVGGGMVTFERHFAVIPSSWFDYEIISVTLAFGTSGANTTWAVSSTLESGSSVGVLTKVTRAYYLETNLPTLQTSDPVYTYTAATASFDFTFLTGKKLRADEVEVYMGNIYEVKSYIGA